MAAKAICNQDCFNCPFPDCINDGDATLAERQDIGKREETLRLERIKESKKIRADASKNVEAENRRREKQREYQKKHSKELADYRKRYRAINKERIRERRHNYYVAHREEALAWQKAYDLENHDRILAWRRENWKKKREKKGE